MTVYDQAALNDIFRSVTQTPTEVGKVEAAVQLLQYRYRKDGYFLSKVSGEIEPGPGGSTLAVRVIEGYIGSVKLAGDIGPVGTLVYGYLRSLEAERPLTAKGLERAVLLCQDIPGLTVRTILRPSKDEPGAVELVAQIDRKPFDAYGSLDNRASRATGSVEMLIDGAANSFTSLGERTEFLIYNTPFNNEELFGQLNESALIGASGLKLSAYLGYGELTPGDILRPLEYRSRLLLAGFEGLYPVVRTREFSNSVTLAFDLSHTLAETNDFTPNPTRLYKENLRILRAGDHSVIQDTLLGDDLLAADDIDLVISRGIPGLFDGTPNGYVPAARPDERRDFTKVTLEIARNQSLYSWGRRSLALYLAAEGQWSDDILPPSEKFFLGGSEFGRGFYNGEVSGDRAVAGTAEVQLNDHYDVAILGADHPLDLQYYLFYDAGEVWNIAPGDLDHHIASIGAGVRSTFAEHYFIQLEGVDRLTRRPTQTSPSLEAAQVVYFRVGAKL